MFSVWYWRDPKSLVFIGDCACVYESLWLAAMMRGHVQHNGKPIWSASDEV